MDQVTHPLYARITEALPTAAGTEDADYLTALRGAIERHKPIPYGTPYGAILWICKGCDPGAYAEDDPDAPCSTLVGIGEALGIKA